jgi:hypothetical protein
MRRHAASKPHERLRGTVPATNKSFTIAGIDIHTVKDGKLVEHRHVVDQLSMMQQLGLIPGGG